MKCKDCHYRDECMQCRRRAPIVPLATRVDDHHPIFPVMNDDDWCGEFKAKEKRKKSLAQKEMRDMQQRGLYRKEWKEPETENMLDKKQPWPPIE